jgi:hypothetical protein
MIPLGLALHMNIDMYVSQNFEAAYQAALAAMVWDEYFEIPDAPIPSDEESTVAAFCNSNEDADRVVRSFLSDQISQELRYEALEEYDDHRSAKRPSNRAD